MQLPELPIKRKNDEAKFGVQLVDYVSKLKEPFFEFSVWQELKICKKDNTFYFSQLEPHQVLRCQEIKTRGVFVRIVDARVSGKSGIPDYVWVYKQPAYVVIKYSRSWCFIDIDTFILERDRCKKPTLSESRAKEIAIRVIIR